MGKSLSNNRIKQVSDWLENPANAGPISGVSFSLLHAIIFSGSPSEVVQNLGYASLALNTGVLGVRVFLPSINKRLSHVFNKPLEKLKMPSFESGGFPLFLNGIVLSGIALTAFINGDALAGSISLAYAIANTDKGARISQNAIWTAENLGKKAFNTVAKILPASNTKTGIEMLADQPPRFLKHSLYLPELWGSAGATIYAFSHSGPAAVLGMACATVAVTAAAVNNGDLSSSAISKIPVLNKITSLSDFGAILAASDAVLSRRFMKYASGTFAIGAAALGNIAPAIAHSFGGLGNHVLEKADKSRQLAAATPS